MARSFRRITANARSKQSTTIGNFGGVDLSSPVLEANNARAIDVLNLIKKERFNQKRNGITHLIPETIPFYSQIHGVFTFIDSTNTERIILHSGEYFSVLTSLGEGQDYSDIQNSLFTKINNVATGTPIIMTMDSDEENSFGFASGQYLYVLGGGLYFRFFYDEEEDAIVGESLVDNINKTYIPVTRNSVTPTGSLVEGLSQAYDDVNMLTQWKKNTFVTGTFGTNISTLNPFHANNYSEYKMDSKLFWKSFSDLENCKLNLSYLKTDATALLNQDYANATLYTTNEFNIGQAVATEADFNDFIFKQVAYRSNNPGNDFGIYDMAVKLRYRITVGGGSAFIETPYIKTNGTGGLVLTDTGDTATYIPTNSTAYKYVIDYRPAISSGYLTNPSGGVYKISATAEAQGYFTVPVSLYLRLTNVYGTTYSFTLTENVKVPVQTSAEFLSYQTTFTIEATPSVITTQELVFAEDGVEIGKLYFGDDDEPAKLHLYYPTGISNEYENPQAGITNGEILFPNWTPGYSQRVTQCKFGKLWGYNGARNRLFISGNPQYPNIVYHSSPVNFFTKLKAGDAENVNEDYTYFSDLDYNILGTDFSAVKGMEILATGNLLVLKEDSSTESSIYTLRASLTDAIAFDGSTVKSLDGTPLKEELYIANIGNYGQGGTNPLAILNINNDTLFLSKSGVRSANLSENLPVEETRSSPSSTLINNQLIANKSGFNNAVMYHHDGYGYLALNGTLYVCSQEYQASDIGPKEYEWWIFRGKELTDEYGIKTYAPIYVRNFFTYDGELYFYNSEGLFKFVENQYIDKQVIQINSGDIAFNSLPPTNFDITAAVYNQDIEDILAVGKYVSFKEEQIHNLGSVTYNDTNNTVTFANYEQELAENRKIRVTLGGTASHLNYYYLTNCLGLTCQLKDENGDIVTDFTDFYASGYSYFVAGAVIEPGTDMKILTVDNVNNEFTLQAPYEVTFRFSTPNITSTTFVGHVVEYNNVVSYFITSPFNFGTNINLKTIEKFVITNDTRRDSYVEIQYLAYNDADVFKTVTNTNTKLNLSDLSFNHLYFGSLNLPIPFSLRTNTRNVQSIMFKFYNDLDNNCCLTNITMLYYVTKEIR